MDRLLIGLLGIAVIGQYVGCQRVLAAKRRAEVEVCRYSGDSEITFGTHGGDWPSAIEFTGRVERFRLGACGIACTADALRFGDIRMASPGTLPGRQIFAFTYCYNQEDQFAFCGRRVRVKAEKAFAEDKHCGLSLAAFWDSEGAPYYYIRELELSQVLESDHPNFEPSNSRLEQTAVPSAAQAAH